MDQHGNPSPAAGTKPFSLLQEQDVYLFKEGTHGRLYEKLGAHLVRHGQQQGVYFAVWAPNARAVSVVGDFNDWKAAHNVMDARPDGSGIWEAFVPDLGAGERYKFRIESSLNDYVIEKGDPFASYWETAPKTATITYALDYQWGDGDWMATRAARNAHQAPQSIYEVHLGSWRRKPEDDNRSLSYREIAEPLAAYVREAGFTHVELLPLTEHPFYGSWGYQTTGYFAPTSRYGTPEDFMFLVDTLHQHGIGVIMDWVPSHFPSDAHGLSYFDGTYLFEHADPKRGYHPEWNSYIFNYGRHEVRAFLISSALSWLDRYHIDGLRVDAVASMLYLDYARKQGEWIPNEHGGNENLDAIHFLRTLNEAVYREFPDTQTFAEESTAWPMVSRPTHVGGLGFGMKWNMGWMHDSLQYFGKDPVHRKYHHNQLTFGILYAFHENFVLPLSHDEVVHGKGSLLRRMPGDDWRRFANLRLLMGYMYTHPGKKLLFMGGEFGQWKEWNHDASLDWHLLDEPLHGALFRWMQDVNRTYREQPALHQMDFSPSGFSWIDCNDSEDSTLSYLRVGTEGAPPCAVVCNFTPLPRDNYRIGVPREGYWKEVLNSDAELYGGSGRGNLGGVYTDPVAAHGRLCSLTLTLPPLAILVLQYDESGGDAA